MFGIFGFFDIIIQLLLIVQILLIVLLVDGLIELQLALLLLPSVLICVIWIICLYRLYRNSKLRYMFTIAIAFCTPILFSTLVTFFKLNNLTDLSYSWIWSPTLALQSVICIVSGYRLWKS